MTDELRELLLNAKSVDEIKKILKSRELTDEALDAISGGSVIPPSGDNTGKPSGDDEIKKWVLGLLGININ